jgi:hypothetical protein
MPAENHKKAMPAGASYPEWARLLCKYWRGGDRSLITSEADVYDVERELERTFDKQPDNMELCKVVRFMAGPEWGAKYSPTLKEFITAIFTLRKRERFDTSAPQADCYYCQHGVMTYFPDWQPGWTSDEFATAYRSTIPCRCTAGQSAMDKCKPWCDMTEGARIRMFDNAATAQQAYDAFMLLTATAGNELREQGWTTGGAFARALDNPADYLTNLTQRSGQ